MDLLPDSPRLILCERRREWAVALRRVWEAGLPRIYESRFLDDTWDELRRTPASLCGLELRVDNVERICEFLIRQRADFPQSRSFIMADRGVAAAEWTLRELGAVHFVASPRELAPIAGLARSFAAFAPRTSLMFTERIWASLPWS